MMLLGGPVVSKRSLFFGGISAKLNFAPSYGYSSPPTGAVSGDAFIF